jgi:hypothetical protein
MTMTAQVREHRVPSGMLEVKTPRGNKQLAILLTTTYD